MPSTAGATVYSRTNFLPGTSSSLTVPSATLLVKMGRTSSSAWPRVRRAVSVSASAPQFKVGTRVRHEKFGDGAVTLVDGNKLTIDFDDGTTKRVVASFVDSI